VTLFGRGLTTARATRSWLLERLGAESEWLVGAADDPTISWLPSVLVTRFTTAPTGPDTPDLGFLRVVTLAARVGDENIAREVCNALNAVTTTNRWLLAGASGDGPLQLEVGCSFVVSAHNAPDLGPFILACVREQIAIATAKVTNGIADLLEGEPLVYSGPAGVMREEWNRVVYHYDDVVTPNRDLPSDPLWQGLKSAFASLQDEMFRGGGGAWYGTVDGLGLLCEMPFSWRPYPAGMIGDASAFPGADLPPTVLVRGSRESNPNVGNGVQLAMRPPARADDPGRIVGTLNELGDNYPGATHRIGAWVHHGGIIEWTVFLPSGLAYGDNPCDPSSVCRLVLLTAAREGLLARRALLPADEWEPAEAGMPVGLAARNVQHGLAWGESGEGANPAAHVLSHVYQICVGGDIEWSLVRADAFDWWPYRQRQQVLAQSAPGDDILRPATIWITTEVRRGVPRTNTNLIEIARRNAQLSRSALILNRETGQLDLACRLSVHTGTEHWVSQWAKELLADQFITARSLATKLEDLGGEEATSQRPGAGPRPSPDELFGIRETLRQMSEDAGDVYGGPVLPLAATALAVLPHRLQKSGDRLSLWWRPRSLRGDIPADPLIHVTAQHAVDAEVGPGLLVRTAIRVRRTASEKAAWWCNEQNQLLLMADEADEPLSLPSGWGLEQNNVCLSTWLSRSLAPAPHPNSAAGLVANMIRYQQTVVIAAITGSPEMFEETPVSQLSWAQDIGTLFEPFRETLDYDANCTLVVEPGGDGALAEFRRPYSLKAHSDLCEHPQMAEPIDVDGAPALITRLNIPIVNSRPPLALLNTAILAASQTRFDPLGNRDDMLLPGVPGGQTFTDEQISCLLDVLYQEGVINETDSDGWTVNLGRSQARLEIETYVHPTLGPGTLRLRLTSPGARQASPPAFARETLGAWSSDEVGNLRYVIALPLTLLTWPALTAVVQALERAVMIAVAQIRRVATPLALEITTCRVEWRSWQAATRSSCCSATPCPRCTHRRSPRPSRSPTRIAPVQTQGKGR
jgi:hypothetical protein